MFALILVIIIVAILVVVAGSLAYAVLRSVPAAKPEKEPHFYLPNDFFITLVLLANFWLILLVLLGSQELLPTERNMIVILASLLAPFLSWWRKKKAGAE